MNNESPPSCQEEEEPLFAAAVLYDYTADTPRRVSLTAGGRVEVLRNTGRWWRVRIASGHVGLAPSNFLQPLPSSPARRMIGGGSTSSPSHRTNGNSQSAVRPPPPPLHPPPMEPPFHLFRRTDSETKTTNTGLSSEQAIPQHQQQSQQQQLLLQQHLRQQQRVREERVDIIVDEIYTLWRKRLVEDNFSAEDMRKASQVLSDRLLSREDGHAQGSDVKRGDHFSGSVGHITLQSAANRFPEPLQQRSSAVAIVQKWWRMVRVRRQYNQPLKVMRMRRRSVLELVSTETSYIEQLERLQTEFMRPIQDYMQRTSSQVHSTPLDAVTATVPLILNVNKELLSQLHSQLVCRGEDGDFASSKFPAVTDAHYHPVRTLVGAALLSLAPYFRLYMQYVNNFDSALREVEQRARNDRGFAAVLCRSSASTSSDMDISGALRNLNTLLIVPVQRVPRYALTLKEIAKYTPPSHPDAQPVASALATISDIAAELNEKKRDEESKMMVRTVSRVMGDRVEGLLAPHRRFVRHGEVMADSECFCSSSAERRLVSPFPAHLFLFNDLLVIAAPPRLPMSLLKKNLRRGIASVYQSAAPLDLPSSAINNFAQPSLAPSSFSSTSHTDVMALSVDDELKFQEKIELSRCVVTPERLVIYPNLYGFVIEMSNRQPDSFFCSSQEDRDMWVKAIREAVSKNNERRRTLKLEGREAWEVFDPWAVDRAIDTQAQEEESSTDPQDGDTSQLSNTNVSQAWAEADEYYRKMMLDSDAETHLADAHSRLSINSCADATNDIAAPRMYHSSSDVTESFSPLGEVLPLYSEAFWLLRELFQLPIELQTLIPEYVSRLPPGYINEIGARLDNLKRRIRDLRSLNHRCAQALNGELELVQLGEQLVQGKPILHDIFIACQSSTPSNQHQYDDVSVKESLRTLLRWYNAVMTSWKQLTEKSCV